MEISREPAAPAARRDERRHGLRWGAALAAIWLAVALVELPRYGPTLDETVREFPYGEGLLHWIESRDVTLAETLVAPVAPPVRAPHPNFAYDQPWYQVWPLGSFLSALSCRLCWTKAGWLGAVAAHHLPVPIFVAALLVVMVAWMVRRLGILAGIGAAVALLASPRFFADAIHNLKDAPETALYVLAWFAVPRAVERATLRAWALAAVLAAAALAQKANALFLAPQGLAWLAVVACTPRDAAATAVRATAAPGRRPLWLGLLFALLVFVAAYFALSPQLWVDPLDHVEKMYRQVLVHGSRVTLNAVRPADGVTTDASVSFGCVALVAWTTPPLVLLLALAGLFARRLPLRDRLFLLIGVAVPIGRNLLPGSLNFDGVRHYLEFMPCLALLAGAGLDAVTRSAARLLARRSEGAATAVRFAAASVLLLPGAVEVVRTEPNGIAYFNVLVGGLAGAQARGVPDATDYWGNSYWQALDWLDLHAEPGAAIHVAVFPPIVRAVAHYRLRPDLQLARIGRSVSRGPLYVVYVTRRSWYDRTLREIDAASPKVHEILVDGAPILRVVRFDAGEPTRAVLERFVHSAIGANLRMRIVAWSLKDARARADLAAILAQRSAGADDATLERLRRLLPPELHDGLEDFLLEIDASR